MALDSRSLLSILTIISINTVASLANGGEAVVVVNGTLGDSVWLPYPQPLSLGEIRHVEWSLQTPGQVLAEYYKGEIEYYDVMRIHVTENLTVQISDLQLTHTGVYKVETVMENGSKYENRYNLTVYEQVSGVEITSSLTKGQCNGTLTCDVKSGKPVIFVWERDGVHLPISQPSDTATLSVTLSPNDNYTVFTCKAGNPVSEDSKEISFQDREFCVKSPNGSVIGKRSDKPSGTPRVHIIPVVKGVIVLILFLLVLGFAVCNMRKQKGKNQPDKPVDVTGVLGDLISLPYPESLSLEEIRCVEWSLQASGQTIAEYQAGKVDYFGSEEMKKRVTVHTEKLTVQISDLQLTDTGVYRVVTTTKHGRKLENLYNLTVDETSRKLEPICPETKDGVSEEDLPQAKQHESEPPAPSTVDAAGAHREEVEGSISFLPE